MSHRRGLVLLVWADIAPELEAGFNEWYNREHVPDRVLRVPGFLVGRRFVAVSGAPRYFMFYEIAGPEVLDSDVYINARRNSDENSRRFQPHIGNVHRLLGDTVVDAGQGEGSAAAIFAVDAQDAGGGFEAWAHATLPGLVERPGIVRTNLYRANRASMDSVERLSAGSVRSGLRPPDRIVTWMLVVEATTAEAAGEVRSDLEPAICAHRGAIAASGVLQQMIRLAC